MEILEPHLEFELPFKKDKDGNYVVFPRHIGGKNCLRKLASTKYKEAYIYFLNIVGTDKYKIGVSINPQKRVKEISNYIPFELKLLAVNKINDAYEFEQSLLDKYNSNSIRNEWFEFNIKTVKEIMITLHNKQVIDNRQNVR